ncbi:Uncharacterized conserved protein YdeI, YjbR/CyaY-like superfamily, DUF1801 family [Friedmanniella luteola]|uniref:Uncharacterized conserved protein YdeI, YjbR/CyaY-like superfamily, DUF1801 family n=1 Tax=Friedmanniella luteola TaxID=546871 RepID=A0A1H1SX41_9ACTN|nr:YdeI/OmpD-associated family protein [Friedmanniella luteola]SDS52511.1 Uncharacterized conserved protein YdeI, YjbR/CyaY-like superfamily, DUF1801 family [Friedmanniella luteola]
MSATYEQVQVDSRAQWRAWLTEHGADSPGVWLLTWKKGAGPHVAYGDIVDEALCFGWVDSQPRAVDEARSSRLLTPRRPGSSWSRVNKQRVQHLTEAGLMTAAGLAVIDAAKADGSWTALDLVEDLVEPDDLHVALNAQPQARVNWDNFPRSTKRAILEWIGAAKTDTTHNRRVQQTVDDAAAGRRAHQWRQPKPP